MASQGPTAARINSQTFFAVLWSGTGLSLCFLIFRIFSRIKSFRRVFADDFLVLVAWTMLLVSAVILQTQQTAMYRQFAINAGTIIPTPERQKAEIKLLHTEAAILLLYYTSLWIVKLSFLVFFRRLGQKIIGQKIWWWCVLVFTVGTWASCIGSMSFKCLLSSLDYFHGKYAYSISEALILTIEAECTHPSARDHERTTEIHNCVVDVVSDLAIITIPVLMLWNVRISWGKKLILMAIFSLTIIVIIVSVVRIILITSKHKTGDTSWLYLWSGIEVIISIIVACLASFRQLYIKSEQSRRIQEGSFRSFRAKHLLSAFRSSKFRSLVGRVRSYTRNIFRRKTLSTPDSTEWIVPLDSINVVHQASVSSNAIDQAT